MTIAKRSTGLCVPLIALCQHGHVDLGAAVWNILDSTYVETLETKRCFHTCLGIGFQ